MAKSHLLPSQGREIDEAFQVCGLNQADFHWVLIDGEWAGTSAQTPMLRHRTEDWWCRFAEAPKWSESGRPLNGGKLVHTLEISPAEHRRTDFFQRESWPGALSVVRDWLGFVRRELGMPPIPMEKQPEVMTTPLQALRRVFLIHGHDEANKLKVSALMKDRYNLETTILGEVPGGGRTLIEKFEEEASKCGFAIALLTPDDVVAAADGPYSQSRPNVAFELGWFFGRLGRHAALIVLRRGVRLHSDLDGISRVEFRDSVSEALPDIERELRAAGML